MPVARHVLDSCAILPVRWKSPEGPSRPLDLEDLGGGPFEGQAIEEPSRALRGERGPRGEPSEGAGYLDVWERPRGGKAGCKQSQDPA